MSEPAHIDEPAEAQIDGRAARRERNRDAVLDVVLEMWGEDLLFPTIEQASKRSGLSLRSVYRYFPDPVALLEAAIRRNIESIREFALLPQIGQGPLGKRIDDFVAMRVRLFERVGPLFRATLHNAPKHPRIHDELHQTRQDLRNQFELQFAAELEVSGAAGRQDTIAAGDVLTQFDSIDLLRRYRQLTVTETEVVLRSALSALLEQR